MIPYAFFLAKVNHPRPHKTPPSETQGQIVELRDTDKMGEIGASESLQDGRESP